MRYPLIALISASGCASPAADPGTLAIHVSRGEDLSGAVDDLLVRVDLGGKAYQHRAKPTDAFDAQGDVVLFLAGDLRGGCTVIAEAYGTGVRVGAGSAEAMLGSDADVVVEVGAASDDDCAACPTVEPSPDLRGWWRFEDSGDALDSSGHDNDAVPTGAPAREPGVIGEGLSLPGDSRLIAADGPSLDFAGEITIESWIRPDLLSGNCGTSGNAIVSKWRVAPLGQFQLATCSSGQIRFLVSNGTQAAVVTGARVLAEGETAHVAARVTGATATVFVDGRREAELPVPAGVPATIEHPDDDVYIGGAAASDWDFEGMIDEVRIWSIARTDTEICRDAGGEPTEAGCDLSEVLP